MRARSSKRRNVFPAGAGPGFGGAPPWRRWPGRRAWWGDQGGSGAGGPAERIDAAFWADASTGLTAASSHFELAGKPLLVNFWATWCPPCIEEMPMIDGFFREHGPTACKWSDWLSINRSTVRKFLGRTPVTYPIGLAGLQGTDVMIRIWAIPPASLPFTLVIDADAASRRVKWACSKRRPQDVASGTCSRARIQHP